jgi:hypothetical protein
MPEQIRLKVGGVTPQQMAVYEEFARNIPGFLPLTDRDAAMFIPKSVAVNLLYSTVTFVLTCNNKVENNWWKLLITKCI